MNYEEQKKYLQYIKDTETAFKAFKKSARDGAALDPPDTSPEEQIPAGTFDDQMAEIGDKSDVTLKRTAVLVSKQTSDAVKNILPANIWMFYNSQNPSDKTVFVQNNTSNDLNLNEYFIITPAGSRPKISAPWGMNASFKSGTTRTKLNSLWTAISNNTFNTLWDSAVKEAEVTILPMTKWTEPRTPDPPEPPTPVVTVNTLASMGMTKSTNWQNNAAKRYMCLLSPNCTVSNFNNIMQKMKNGGCNYVNLFVCNNNDTSSDSEYKNYKQYSIYGSSISSNSSSWSINNTFVNNFKTKLNSAKNTYGLKIALWLVADDDGNWNDYLSSNWTKYVNDLDSCGILAFADCVVLGLELNEYWSRTQVKNNLSILKALRSNNGDKYKWPLGVHQGTDQYDFATLNECDVMFFQSDPNKSDSYIKNKVQECVNALGGKEVCAFEIDWDPNLSRCNNAFSVGAVSVGNWSIA